jgi:hypothetical protein
MLKEYIKITFIKNFINLFMYLIYEVMLMKKKDSWCCWGGKKGFPTFATLILALGVLWLLTDLKVITIDIPWWPVILIIVAVGWIIDHYAKR